MTDLALIELIGRKPGPFGDIIIFWEVPDGWILLTRDKTFSLLKEGMNRDLTVYYVRPPRETCNLQCVIQNPAGGNDYSGTLLNRSATGVALSTQVPLGSRGTILKFNFERSNGFKEGRIVRVEERPKEFFYGVKLIRRKRSSSLTGQPH
jgi:hypothetical protein